ncbi:uncharacterized protein LOC120337076 isoform X2 [Styela clava]
MTNMNHHWIIILLITCFASCENSNCPVTSLPPDWTMISVPDSEYCFVIVNSKTNPLTARQECRKSFKGYLARFHDVASLCSLARKIKINTKRIWIDMVSKPNGNWIWSDGSTVSPSVLGEIYSDDPGSSGSGYCGALTDQSTPEYSKWKGELCTANHEYICQAPKLDVDLGDCVNSTFRQNNKCYAVSDDVMTFTSATNFCEMKHHGHLASLESLELAVSTGNYFDMKRSELDNVRVWLDIKWSEENKMWQHSDGEQVTAYEENWYSTQKVFANGRTHVVLDQSVDWKWRSRLPTWKAYVVCEVGKKTTEHIEIDGRAILPKGVTRSLTNVNHTTASGDWSLEPTTIETKPESSPVNINMLVAIGFGTQVSFDFMNPEYGHISDTFRPTPATPLQETINSHIIPQELDEEETYAIISDYPMSPPISTIDLLQAPHSSMHSSLNLSRTTQSRNKVQENASTLSLQRTHYSSRVSTEDRISQESFRSRDPTSSPAQGRHMTSFTSSPNTAGNRSSPYYPQMSTKPEQRNIEQSALQYAELSFKNRDEDDRFQADESCYVINPETANQQYDDTDNMNQQNNVNETLTQRNGDIEESLQVQNSCTSQMQEKEQTVLDRPIQGHIGVNRVENLPAGSVYENEIPSPSVSPYSPQFPLQI